MDINIYQLISGAQKADGLVVIIDVFRAFTTACYLFANGAEKIYTVSKVETALKLKKELNNPVLVGERDGKKLKGFDFGNSPSIIDQFDFSDKEIVQTTSAGTKGIINARNAEEIITGSFANSSSIIKYIKNSSIDKISLVAMGVGGKVSAEEDLLCAKYLKNSLLGKFELNKDELIEKLKNTSGKRFFVNKTQEDMPEDDFYYSLEFNKFNFILKAEKEKEDVYRLNKIKII